MVSSWHHRARSRRGSSTDPQGPYVSDPPQTVEFRYEPRLRLTLVDARQRLFRAEGWGGWAQQGWTILRAGAPLHEALAAAGPYLQDPPRTRPQ